jgi:stage II sporulation protein D
MVSAAALFMFLLSCARMMYLPPVEVTSPIVRIGILENKDEIRFTPRGAFYIVPLTSSERTRLQEEGVWTVTVGQSNPAISVFQISLYETSVKQNADEELIRLRQKGKNVALVTIGETLEFSARTVVDRRVYRIVLQDEFASSEDADSYKSADKTLSNGRIVERIKQPPSGFILIKSPEGESYKVDSGCRISGPVVTLKDVNSGQGFHFEKTQDRSYVGEMEIRLGNDGKLLAINVLPLESYLRSVVQGEMPDTFPLEALKAQAVASRTYCLYRFGRSHLLEPFDFCDEVHCQTFVGYSADSPDLANALAQTRGLVLTYNGDLCLTTYAAVCGGHTESAENVWQSDGIPYLQGVYDVDPAKFKNVDFDLSSEENVSAWIRSEPDVFCNVIRGENQQPIAYAKKYFRWEQRISRADLEQIISKKTGENFGQLVDIIPGRRGVSGRLMEIKIIGTLKSFTLSRELNIRRALSENALYSACFIIEKKGEENRLADEFIFKGAGWGHGTGMCQIGAAKMAYAGYRFDQILSHYYCNTQLQALY